MKNRIKAYFPKSKLQWKEFMLLTLPVVGGSLLFALNSFIDNFMVGHIKGANAGLFAVNSWTSIIMGIFVGSAATGSILVAQYFYAGKHDKVRDISRIRFIITFSVALVFAIASWVCPDEMVKIFMGKPAETDTQSFSLYNAALIQGKLYMKYIAGMWLLIALTFNTGNMCRETGWGKIPFIGGIFGLIFNILLNFLTMHTRAFGYQLQAEGTAIATIAARCAVLLISLCLILNKKVPILFWPWTIFKISRTIHEQFWIRGLVFLFTATTMAFITLRNKLYVVGYPSGSIRNANAVIGSADMLSITWSIFGIVAVIFNAINTVVSKFVGGELGKGNIEKAKENSKRVHGFMLVLTLPFCLLGSIAPITMPYMSFLQQTDNPARDALVLKQASLGIIALIIFLPLWNWFITSKSATLAGGKVNLVTTIDVITAGPLFLGWMALVLFVIVPATNLPFWVAYLLCFLADIPRGAAFMWVYYKKNWAFNITEEKSRIAKAVAIDNMENETLKKE